MGRRFALWLLADNQRKEKLAFYHAAATKIQKMSVEANNTQYIHTHTPVETEKQSVERGELLPFTFTFISSAVQRETQYFSWKISTNKQTNTTSR